MDQTLGLKKNEFAQALASLELVLGMKKDEVIRDSVIKRFEYCFELAWKTGKVLLRERFGTDVASPKDCFRELRRNGLLKDEEVELLLQMTDDRNQVIHTYGKKFADVLFVKIAEEYARLLRRVYVALSA